MYWREKYDGQCQRELSLSSWHLKAPKGSWLEISPDQMTWNSELIEGNQPTLAAVSLQFAEDWLAELPVKNSRSLT